MIPTPYFAKKVGDQYHLLCGKGTVPLIKTANEDASFVTVMADLLNQAYENGWKQSEKKENL